MESYPKAIHAVRYVGGTILIIGIAIFLYGFFVSSYSYATSVGIGTIMSAVFIFIMGMFLLATEEMLLKTQRAKK